MHTNSRHVRCLLQIGFIEHCPVHQHVTQICILQPWTKAVSQRTRPFSQYVSRNAITVEQTSKFAFASTLLMKYAPCNLQSLKLQLRQSAAVKFDLLKSFKGSRMCLVSNQ